MLFLQRFKLGLERNPFFVCQSVAHRWTFAWTFETSRRGYQSSTMAALARSGKRSRMAAIELIVGLAYVHG